MTGHVTHEISTDSRDRPAGGAARRGRALELFRTLADGRLRTHRTERRIPARPVPTNTAVDLSAANGLAPAIRVPRSEVIRSACGLPSFLGLLSLDGTLLEFNQTATTPPELNLHHTLDQPFWEATWWSWSPLVQHRLRAAVALVVTGRVLRHNETALVRRHQLVTMDLAWAPLISSGTVTGVICSAIEIPGREPAA
jgi:hypothetical protein